MEVILLERIAKLGQMGDTVRVKDGFARNFLLPKGKALRATSANKAKFEGMKQELEVRNLSLKGEAEQVANRLNGQSFAVIRQAAETGQLFGSVSARDLADLIIKAGFTVERSQIVLNAPIKSIGQHKVPVALHPDVEVTVTVNVARSADEAERLARGENVIMRRDDGDDDEADEAAKVEAAKAAAEKFFEPGSEKTGEETEDAAPAAEASGESEKPAKPAKPTKERAPKEKPAKKD